MEGDLTVYVLTMVGEGISKECIKNGNRNENIIGQYA